MGVAGFPHRLRQRGCHRRRRTITRIQLRRGTSAAWASAQPVLAQGEPGLETDTGFLKLGDGVSAWPELGYADVSPAVAVVSAPNTFTADQRFDGNVGIGVAPGTYSPFDYVTTEAQTTTARPVGMHLGFSIAPPSMPSQFTDFHGVDLVMTSSFAYDGTHPIRFYPLESNPVYGGAGHMTQLVGVYGYPNNTGSGRVDEALSYRALTENSGSGTVTLAEGIRAEGVLVPVGATPVSTYYGVHVLDLTDMAGVWGAGYQTPTLGFSLYCEGGQSFHRDSIGLGDGNNVGPYNGLLDLRPPADATGLHVRAAAAQTGELLQIHDNSNDPLLAVTASGQLRFGSAANEALGSGSAGFGANCPAVTASAPYTWEKVTTSDGSQGYMPVWK